MNNHEFDVFFEELGIEQLLELFRRLPVDSRIEIFNHFCPYCGQEGECGCAAYSNNDFRP